MDDVIVARALHVLAVVLWIGGVSMVTMVVFPAIRRGQLGKDWLAVFQAVERRFSWQARLAVAVVGLTGLYMCWRLDLWDRFLDHRFWWMHAMVGVWLLFAFMLFVVEPFVLRGRFKGWASAQPVRAFAWLHRAHWLLLVLSTLTIAGAVLGSHGW